MAAPKKQSFGAFATFRTQQVWEKLQKAKLDPVQVLIDNMPYLDEREKCAIAVKLMDFYMVKPKPIEEIPALDTPHTQAKLDESYELLKAITQDRLNRECQKPQTLLPEPKDD